MLWVLNKKLTLISFQLYFQYTVTYGYIFYSLAPWWKGIRCDLVAAVSLNGVAKAEVQEL